MTNAEIHQLLQGQLKQYHNSAFIESDPVCIPHRFTQQQDVEIAGFFAAILAWGNRKSIISSCTKLMQLMDNAPHAFVLGYSDKDLKRFEGFVHRTFLLDDLLYFLSFMQWHYQQHDSLEQAFLQQVQIAACNNVELPLVNFRNYFFSLPHLPRTHKHIATPERGSACKRLNMFLRWMVRKDKHGIDFGIWRSIKPHQLVMPLDVHVSRVAHQLGFIDSPKASWATAVRLTQRLSLLNPQDPVLYDYALFGLGVSGRL
jgi:uncharacterized protein (TIGR02757 family)